MIQCLWAVFGLGIGFAEYLYTQLVTARNYSSLHWFTDSKDHFNCSTYKVFYVFTSRFLVTDPNNVLCLRRYRLVNIPQLTKLKIKVRVTSQLAVYRQSVLLGVKPL
jgi:hypothetical protein